MTAPTRTFAVDLPVASWIELPGESEDVASWAAELAAELQAGGTPDETAGGAVHELEAHLATVRKEDVDLAVALMPEPAAGVLALLTVSSRRSDDRLRQLESEFRASTVGAVRPPQLENVDLPCGAALRAQLLVSATDEDDEAQTHAIGEIVTFLVRTDVGLVTLTLRWAALALGQELSDLADECAQGLRIG